MSELLLFSPILIALPPGLWSFGHTKRMFWTLMALLLGPVLVAVPGVMMLGRFGLTWRCVVWRWCGLCFLAGIAELFVWGVVCLWKEVPAERWHWLAVWLSRTAILIVIGGMCAGFTVFSSLIVLFCADSDYIGELDGEKVVVQYLLDEGCNYYAYHGPLLRGTELLEGSAVLEQHRKEANEYRNQNHHHVFFLGLADRCIHRSDHVCEIHEGEDVP